MAFLFKVKDNSEDPRSHIEANPVVSTVDNNSEKSETAEDVCTSTIASEVSHVQNVPEDNAASVATTDDDQKVEQVHAEVTYTKEQYEAVKKNAENTINELTKKLEDSRHDNEALEKKRSDDSNLVARKENFKEYFFKRLSEGGLAQYTLAKEFAECKVISTDIEKIRNDNGKLQSDLKKTEEARDEAVKESVDLNNQLTQANSDISKLSGDLDQRNQQLTAANEQLHAYNGLWERVLRSLLPTCFNQKAWFESFLCDLQTAVCTEVPNDAAILVFASLSELAVMERDPAKACFDWKKQLVDIGLVVANYMHQKGVAENVVVDTMRNFATAILELPSVSSQGIMIRVPGPSNSFNVNEVQHMKKGTSIAKVLNWCIYDANGVYCKAKVE